MRGHMERKTDKHTKLRRGNIDRGEVKWIEKMLTDKQTHPRAHASTKASSKLRERPYPMLAIKTVRQFPPSESFSNRVSLLLRYGMWQDFWDRNCEKFKVKSDSLTLRVFLKIKVGQYCFKISAENYFTLTADFTKWQYAYFTLTADFTKWMKS